MARFLTFVVEESLRCGPDAVKESTVAIGVFDRPADFNPRLDPVVRSEVRRLREKLKLYYETEGRQDSLRITIPKGGYVPHIEPQDSLVPAAGDTPVPVEGESTRQAWHPKKWLLALAAIAVPITAALWIATEESPTEARTPLRIEPVTGQLGQEFHPSISPDGKRIAFVREGADGNLDLYIKQPAGDPVRLTTNPENDLHPAWSPDGEKIAFFRSTPEAGRLMMVPGTGGPEKEILNLGTFDPGHVRTRAGPLRRQPSPGPAWSPDGKTIAFRKCMPMRESGCPLYLVSMANSETQRLTEQIPDTADFSPAWSPDGTRIAFARFTGYLTGDIYLVKRDGGGSIRITNESRDIRGITWAPDGRHIIFSSNRAGPYGLWKVSLQSRTISPVPAAGENVIDPVFSRDGKQLLYADASINVNISRIDLRSGGVERLITSTRQNLTAAWSPDGKRIAFVSDRLGPWELWIANADGSGAVPLTAFKGGALGRVEWSPDGKWIAFDARPKGRWEVFLVSPDGGPTRKPVPDLMEQQRPTWSRDGQWIYFRGSRGTVTQGVWRAALSGGAAQLVCPRPTADMAESPDGKILYMSDLVAGFWQMALPSDRPVPVPELERVGTHRWWTVEPAGIWSYDDLSGEAGIFFYDFATRKVRRWITLTGVLPVDTPGLSLSPDRRYLLFSRVDNASSKVMSMLLER